MKIENLEKNNNLEISNNIVNEKNQKNFLETSLGKTVNTAIDLGLRAILPDFVEDQIINIKDNLLNYGLKDGISQTISDAIDLGKSAIGIVTGNFENVGQMQKAVQKGGLIDGISSLIDTVVDKVKEGGIINKNIASTIKQGKSVIVNSIESNINKNFENQYKSIDNINKYMSNWKKSFDNKDFSGMEKEFNKIEKQLKNVVPIENTIKNARTIETLHNLIKNNGQDFNLNSDQLELINKLI